MHVTRNRKVRPDLEPGQVGDLTLASAKLVDVPAVEGSGAWESHNGEGCQPGT